MLSLLKRNADSGASSLIPAWHPDFRNYSALPDIKVVRTAFFVNGAAVFIAIALFVFLGAREYELYSLRSQVNFWQIQIDRDKGGSAQAIQLYKKFQDEEQRINEASVFIKSRVISSDLLQRIGETRPRNIALDYVEIRDSGVTIRGVVRGASELATGEVTAYIDLLKKDPVLGPRFDDITATSVTRTSAGGRLRVEVLMRFKAAKK